MNWMVLPNQVCLIVKLYNNRPGLLPDSNEILDANVMVTNCNCKRVLFGRHRFYFAIDIFVKDLVI